MEATTTAKRPKTVEIPKDVLQAFKALGKKFTYKYQFADHCQLTDNTIRNILRLKYCAPDTLDKLYELTGIANPEKEAA